MDGILKLIVTFKEDPVNTNYTPEVNGMELWTWIIK